MSTMVELKYYLDDGEIVIVEYPSGKEISRQPLTFDLLVNGERVMWTSDGIFIPIDHLSRYDRSMKGLFDE